MILSEEEEAIHLTTTVMPLPTKCKRLRLVRDHFESWWMRRSPWRKTLFPVKEASLVQGNFNVLTLPPTLLERAAALQKGHDAHMHRETARTCRTQPLTMERATKLVEGTGVILVSQITCGGMSRIFSTADPNVLVKISDVSRGWSRYEPHGYDLLQQHDLPTATVIFAHCRQGYMVIAVERLQCTVASILKTAAMDNGLYLDEVTQGLQRLLHALRCSNITFGDLSPDNIMCRLLDPHGVELVLIDPQFVTYTKHLEGVMGCSGARAFDTIHLALKIQALGTVSRDPAVQRAANAVCCALLGRDTPPPKEYMVQWLLHDVPIGLRLAYTSLEKTHGQKNILRFSYETKISHPQPQRKESILPVGVGKESGPGEQEQKQSPGQHGDAEAME